VRIRVDGSLEKEGVWLGEGAVDLLPSADLDIWISIIRPRCVVVVASTAGILFNNPLDVTNDICRIGTLTLLTVFVWLMRERSAEFCQQFQLTIGCFSTMKMATE
jgi:hypothetical protein